MSVLLYKSIEFPKFEHDQRVIYVQNFFPTLLKSLSFLSLMQCESEFHFAGFTPT